jgi:hypothetical protein
MTPGVFQAPDLPSNMEGRSVSGAPRRECCQPPRVRRPCSGGPGHGDRYFCRSPPPAAEAGRSRERGGGDGATAVVPWKKPKEKAPLSCDTYFSNFTSLFKSVLAL